MPRPTRGIGIRRISLVDCRFAWTKGERISSHSEKRADTQPERSLAFKTKRQVVNATAEKVELTVTVDVAGIMNGAPLWEMSVTYLGEFHLAADSEVSQQLLTEVHGPAYVYAFCRECVADLARRSRVADDLFLPPFNFQAEAE